MKILPSSSYTRSLWKNGGGVTHEIWAAPLESGFAWRLSIAEVGCDGPFSIFTGMDRILTVIEGAGLDLVSTERPIPIAPFTPTAFSGEHMVSGVLRAGPVRNLNLIFDPDHVTGHVNVLGHGTHPIRGAAEATQILYSAVGQSRVSGQDIAQGDCAIWTGDAVELQVPKDAMAVLVRINTVQS